MTKALGDIRVLDVSGTLPHDYCSMFFSDMGADVIRVERIFPEGYGRNVGEEGSTRAQRSINVNNRNKRSVLFDLKTPKGLQIFKDLVKVSDVVLDGMRPGTADRLGIGYKVMSKVNPGIIYCSITGYGQDGPYASLVGHDMNYVGVSGILGLTGQEDGPPILPGVPIMDMGCGMMAAFGIMAALAAREKTGKGQYVDVSMTDVAVTWLSVHLGRYLVDGISPTRGKLRLWEGPWLNIYECKDGKWITMANLEPWFWEALCLEIGKPEWKDYPHFFTDDDGEKVREKEIMAELRRILKTKTRAEWYKLLSKKRVAIAPINETLDEVFSDPEVVHRKMLEELDHPKLGKVKQTRHPILYSDTPGTIDRPWPERGQHTAEVLKELGYADKDIASLKRAKVLP